MSIHRSCAQDRGDQPSGAVEQLIQINESLIIIILTAVIIVSQGKKPK